MTDSFQYLVRFADLRPIADALEPLGVLQASDEERLHRTWLDSFDWRLFERGLLLWTDGRGRRSTLTLCDRDTGTELATLSVRRQFGFATDLPAGDLRDRLADVLEMRVLLAVAEVDTRRLHYRLLDDEGKTVMRLVADYPNVRLGGAPGTGTDAPRHAALPVRLTLHPVRGYDEWIEQGRQVLDAMHGVEQPPSDMLTEALMALGRRPRDYSSKLDIPLEPGMTAATAAARIHRYLLDTLNANIEGTCADLDSEFLHDLRVAVRRARSALSQVKGVFSAAVTERFRNEFGWVGQITGPTRDLDVYLLEYEKYRDMLPRAMREDLQPFHDFLVSHQRREQRKLRGALRSGRFANLLQDWAAFLDAPSPSDAGDAPNAERPAAEVAAERIWRMYRRVRKEGRAITPESPAEDLHELRKSCKKLRYLIEFFANLWPADAIKPLVKEVKRLLDNLGEFQDLEVHARQLHDFTGQMRHEGEVSLETLLAMGGLVTSLLQRQEAARETFAERFPRFDREANRAAFSRLFKPVAARAGADS